MPASGPFPPFPWPLCLSHRISEGLMLRMLGSSSYLYFSVFLCIWSCCLFSASLSFPSSSSFSSFSHLTEHDVTSIIATVLLCVLQREVHAEGGVAIVGGAPGPWAAPALLGAGCVRVTQPLCACFSHPRGRDDGSACLAR